MNKKYFILIIVILCAAIMYLTNRNIKSHNKLKTLTENYENLNSTLNNFDNLLMVRFSLFDKKINQNALITNQHGDSIEFNKLINNKPKIVFRHYSKSCNACRKKEIELLLKYENKIGSENIIILTDFNNFRRNNFVIQDKFSNIQIYNVSNTELGLSKDFHYSFVFVTNSEYTINFPYTPIYFLEENLTKYHQYIFSKYFK